MAYSSLDSLFTGICDSIRQKDGTTALIKHQDIPDRIGKLTFGDGPNLQHLGVYANGEYKASNHGVDGFDVVTVNVEDAIGYPYINIVYMDDDLIGTDIVVTNENVTKTFKTTVASSKTFCIDNMYGKVTITCGRFKRVVVIGENKIYDIVLSSTTENYKAWAAYGGVDYTQYSSIDELLADGNALYMMFNSKNAIDYMIDSSTFAEKGTKSDAVMQLIKSNYYAVNLIFNKDGNPWLALVLGSGESIQSFFSPLPKLSSNTGDLFTVSGTGIQNYPLFRAFDDNDSDSCYQYDSTEVSIYLNFKQPINAYYMNLYPTHPASWGTYQSNPGKLNVEICTSQGGTNYVPLIDPVELTNNTEMLVKIPFDKTFYSMKLTIKNEKSADIVRFSFARIQLYIFLSSTISDNFGNVLSYNDYNTWLLSGGIVSGGYPTLADVLSDATAMDVLANNVASIVYMLESTDFIDSIVNSEVAMKALLSNTLSVTKMLNDNRWVSQVLNSSMLNTVANAVPVLTENDSNILVSLSKSHTEFPNVYKAFDGNVATDNPNNAIIEDLSSDNANNYYIGYDFKKKLRLCKFRLFPQVNEAYGTPTKYSIEGSNDGIAWDNLYDVVQSSYTDRGCNWYEYKIDIEKQYTMFRLHGSECTVDSSGNNAVMVKEIQFIAIPYDENAVKESIKDNYLQWLSYTSLDSTKYHSFDDILLDNTALTVLMSSNDAVNYMINLCRKTLLLKVSESDNLIIAISKSEYAGYKCILDDDWRAATLSSEYIEDFRNNGYYIPTMTSNSCNGIILTPSSYYGSAYNSYNLYDNNSSTLFSTSEVDRNQYIIHDLGSAKLIYQILINLGPSILINQAPTILNIYGSNTNDNADWVQLMNEDGIIEFKTSSDQYFNLDKVSEYRYYKVTFAPGTAYNKNSQWDEMQLYGREIPEE